MGKWAEVHCDCPNRIPLAGSDFYFDKPHRNKHRLTKKEKEEVKEWEHTLRNVFACGHRSGAFIEFSPTDIIHLGNVLGGVFRKESAFAVFAKVGDWRSYMDELLLIQPDEAGLWLLEIEEIQRALQGLGNLPPNKIQRLLFEFYRDVPGSSYAVERRINEKTAKPFADDIHLKRRVLQSKPAGMESADEKIMEALADATQLCHASIKTRNPIRLLW